MEIRLITIRLHLEGCRSLKEKRHRLSGFKKRLGRESFIAIMESAFHDVHQSAEWRLVVVADNAANMAQRIDFTEQSLTSGLDARVLEFSQVRIC